MNINSIILNELIGGYGEDTTRPLESYTKYQKQIISLLSANKNSKSTQTYGSALFRPSGKYYGDLDFKQDYYYVGSIQETVDEFEQRLKDVMIRVLKHEDAIFLELKCGFDDRFNIQGLGYWKEGKLYKFDPEYIIEQLQALFSQNLLSDDEYYDIISKVKPDITHEDYDYIVEEFRQLYTIRWTKDTEVLDGVKLLRGNKEITLNECLSHKAIVKIDVLNLTEDNRYIETSMFYILVQIEKNGHHAFINVPQNYQEEIYNSIRSNVETLFYNRITGGNLMKLSKRMFVLARHYKDTKTKNLLQNLLTSDAGLIYQVNSDIKLKISMFKMLKRPPLKHVLLEIDNYKNRLAYVTQIKLDEYDIYRTIDEIVDFNFTLLKTRSVDEVKEHIADYEDIIQDDEVPESERLYIVQKLERLSHYFSDKVNDYADRFLSKFHLLPPPRKYLPKVMAYTYK